MSERKSQLPRAETYEDLEVWKVAMDVAEAVYELTRAFPPEERYGIIAQARSAAISIPMNIAEGWGRGPGASNVNFSRIARGSVYELKTVLQLSLRLKYGDQQASNSLLSEVIKLRQLVLAYVRGMEQNIVREDVAAYSTNGGQ